MGICCSNVAQEQTSTNLNTLIYSIKNVDAGNAKFVIENCPTKFDAYINQFTFYHYLVIWSIYYTRSELKEICDIVYKNRHKFGDHKRPTLTDKYVCYISKSGSTSISFPHEPGYEPYTFKLKDQSPLSLCLEIKVCFLAKQNYSDNSDIIVDLLNKLTEVQEKKEIKDSDVCTICMSNKKNIIFKNCNHISTCQDCSIKLQSCPMCRATIVKKEVVFT
jgi:hypothetical protein